MVTYSIKYFGDTKIGKRKQNQDNFVNFNNDYGFLISIIADGMGGHEGGEIASSLAVESIKQRLQSVDFGKYTEKKIKEIFLFTIKKTLDYMKSYVSEDRKYIDMGTTLNLNVFINDYVYTLNIGDSRTSSITSNAVNQITVDQNLATLTQKYNSTGDYGNSYNILTSSLGPRKDLRIDLYKAKLNNRGYIMVTTDGVHNFIGKKELLNITNNEKFPTLEQKVEQIINMAYNNGSADNLTCTLIQYGIRQ